VKASLTGLTMNVLLKVALMGSLAQVGLALATAIGAWINLLLVLGLAVRAGYLELNRALRQSLTKFALTGVILAVTLWFAARFAAEHLAGLGAHRDEATLAVLIVVGAVVYGAAILALFGLRWLRALVRG
jgi:putative peptidoglycan lipid II flippase